MNIENQPNTLITTSPDTQTVSGVLSSQANLFSPLTNYGNEPDLSEIMGRFHLVDKKEVTPTTFRIYSQQKVPFTKYPHRSLWHALMALHAYGTFDCILRFFLIKPPLVPGKILIQYAPQQNPQFDNLHRSFKVEWDLYENNMIDLPVQSLNPGDYRLLNSSHGFDDQIYPDQKTKLIGFAPSNELYTLGTLDMKFVSALVPGSVYPDSYTLCTFISFKNAIFSIPRNYLYPVENHLVVDV